MAWIYSERRSTVISILVTLLMLAGKTSAATCTSLAGTSVSYEVRNTADASDLAAAVDCSDGSFEVKWIGSVATTDTISIYGGTVLNITGASDGSAVVDGDHETLLFDVDGGTLHLSDVAVVNGGTGAAISASRSVVTATSCSFSDNEGSYGGAVSLSLSDLSLDNTIFMRNSASSYGGAMYASSSVVTVSGEVEFVDNVAEFGGANFLSNSTVVVPVDGDVSFTNNSASNSGGAVYGESWAFMDVAGTATFKANSAIYGGAVRFYDHGRFDVLGSVTFVDNAADQGGAIWLSQGSNMTVFGNSMFSSNRATDGGVFAIFSSTASFSGNVLIMHNNRAESGGCFILWGGASLTTTGEARFTSNIAELGGVLNMMGADSTTIAGNVTMLNNTANFSGGAMYVESPYELVVDDVLFRSNFAYISGGGITMLSAGTIENKANIANCNFDGNRATDAGGALFIVGGFVDITNSNFNRNVAGERHTAVKFSTVASVTYPEVYERFLELVDVVNLDVGWMMSAGCLVETDFYDSLLLATIGPLAVLVLVFGSSVVAKRKHAAEDDGGEAWARSANTHVSVVFWVSFLIYSTVSSVIFQTFTCDNLDNGHSYLRADHSIECYTDTHKAFKAYASIMVIFYPFGIPFCYALVLWRSRAILKTPAAREVAAEVAVFKDLWRPYRPGAFYYEVVECFRRILLAGVVVFIFPNTAGQIVMVFLMAMFFFVVLMVLDPYEDRWDAWLSRIGHLVVMMSMFVALMLKVDIDDDEMASQAVFAGVLVAANCIMVVAVAAEACGMCFVAVRETRGPVAPPRRKRRGEVVLREVLPWHNEDRQDMEQPPPYAECQAHPPPL